MIEITLKEYTDIESCAHGIKGWYTTEPKFPNGEVEWMRWI